MYADRKKKITDTNDAMNLISQSNKILLMELEAVKKECLLLKYEKQAVENRLKEENATLSKLFKDIHNNKSTVDTNTDNVLSKLVMDVDSTELSSMIVQTVINESSNNLKRLIDSKLNNSTTIDYNNDDYIKSLKKQNESLMKSVFSLTEDNNRLRDLLNTNSIEADNNADVRPTPKLMKLVKSVVKLNKSNSNNDITNTSNASPQLTSKYIDSSNDDDDAFYHLSYEDQNRVWNGLIAFIEPFVVNFPSSQLEDFEIDLVTEEVALSMAPQIAKQYIRTNSNVDRILQSSFIVNEIVTFVTLFVTYLNSKK